MIIGLSGKIGTGKSYLANYFLEAHPEYTKLSFGDALKKECSEIYNYPLEWNYSEEGKGRVIACVNHHLNKHIINGMTVREILQWHGTEIRRAEDSDYWVKKMDKIIKPFCPGVLPDVIIDDIRFLNEADLVKKYNGLLIRINPYPEWKPGPGANHRSEIELDCYDDFDILFTPKYGDLKKYVSFIEETIKTRKTI